MGMVVLEKATLEGHTSLANKAREWLRTYWALNALAAHKGPWTEITAVTDTGTFTDPTGNANVYNGLSTPVAGSRRVGPDDDPQATGQATVHLGQFLTTLALDQTPRSWTRPDLVTDQYFSSVRVAVHLLGGAFEPDGTLNAGALPVPAEKFGLSNSERATLSSFVDHPGANRAALDTVLSYIGHGTRCRITFLRTADGTSTWFGNDTGEQTRCNGNKPPWYGVTMTNSGAGTILTPDGRNRSRRNGSKIQAYISNPATGLKEIDVIGGDVIYRVLWHSAGTNVLEYNQPPSTVDFRFVASYKPSAAGDRAELVSETDAPMEFGFYFDETLGNFTERPGGSCNSGQDNDTYLTMQFLGESFDSCTYQGSWDQQPQTCSDGLRQALISGAEIIIGTDDYEVDTASCLPFHPPVAKVRPLRVSLDALVADQERPDPPPASALPSEQRDSARGPAHCQLRTRAGRRSRGVPLRAAEPALLRFLL